MKTHGTLDACVAADGVHGATAGRYGPNSPWITTGDPVPLTHNGRALTGVRGPTGDRPLGQLDACAPSTTTTTAPASTTSTTTSTTIPQPTTTTTRCTEDAPCWDCSTMGNRQCGTTTTTDPGTPAGPCGSYNGTPLACDPPTTTATVAHDAAPASLPNTGGAPEPLAAAGLLLAFVGAVLVRATRKGMAR